MTVLVLEGSTSAAKAMVSGPNGVAVHALPYPAAVADHISIDPDGALSHLLRCGRELIERTGATPGVISLSSVWHGLLALDAHGTPLGRYRTWADAQGLDPFSFHEDCLNRIYRTTGCPPHGSFTLWKLLGLKESGALPTLAATLGEYFFYRLTGRRFQSVASAAGTGLLNLETGKWQDELVKWCGPVDLFDLAPTGATAPLSGEAAMILGLPLGTPVAVSMPDGALNQFAAGSGGGLMTVSVGTSGAARVWQPAPRLSPDRATWCYAMGEGRWLCGGAVSAGGGCIDWFIRTHAPGMLPQELDRLAASADPETAPFFLPFPFGERSPGWRTVRPWGFRGVRENHGLPQLYYALLEGVLMNLNQSVIRLRALCPETDRVQLSGGIVRSALWTQMAADVFGLPLDIYEGQHASLAGAVLAVGGEHALTREERVVAPRSGSPATRRYQQYLLYYGEEPV